MNSSTLFDVAKAFLLISITIYCLYVGINDNFFPEYENKMPLHLKLVPNFQPCEKYLNQQDLNEKCNEEYKKAYVQAESSCDGYYLNFRNCLDSTSRNKCQQESANVNSCVNAIFQTLNDRWKDYSSTT